MSRGRIRRLFLALLFVGGAHQALATSDAQEIRDLFRAYKTALLEGDGATASRLVDAATLEYFEQIKHLALEGSEAEVRSSPFIDRLLVVTMRHELAPGELEAMRLEDLLRHAIKAGWIGKQSIRQLDIGEVRVQGEEATAVALTTGIETRTVDEGEPSLHYRFVRQEGAWRFRFHSLVESLNQVVVSLTDQMGTDEDALIFLLVEQLSGRSVLPGVWQGFPTRVPPVGTATPSP